DLAGVTDHVRAVTGQVHFGFHAAGEFSQLHVFRDVDEHGARPAGRGNVERFGHDLGDVVDVLHQVVVLRDGRGDAVHVRLLKGVGADGVPGGLAGEGNER